MSTAPNPNYALASFGKEASFSYSELLSDGHHVTSKVGVTALKLVRGTIANIAQATGIVTVALGPYNCVVAENCDGTVSQVGCLVYLTGKMKADAVIWPAGQPHAQTANELRDYGIVIESVLYVDGTIVKSVPSAEQEAEAKKRIELNRKNQGAPKESGEKPDLASGLTDSSWGYLTEEERAKNPELADPIPVTASDKEKEEASTHNSKTTPPKLPSHEERGKR